MATHLCLRRTAACGTAAVPSCSSNTSCRASREQPLAMRPSPSIPSAACALPRRRCQIVAAAAPRWNPQNVDNPLTIPSPEISAEETVAVQLNALQNNDEPWGNHGVQTAYEFGEGIGGLEPCWYFGYRKDLYHMDHFGGQFANEFPQLINAQSFEVTAVRELDDSHTMVEAAVVPRGGKGDALSVVFALRKKTLGSRKGAWLTKMLLKGTMGEALEFIRDMMSQ